MVHNSIMQVAKTVRSIKEQEVASKEAKKSAK